MFSKTERMLAFRYLKSRKRTGFVSVIAGFSFLGIMLGVATLIIVMSVMNGFREEKFIQDKFWAKQVRSFDKLLFMHAQSG